MHVLWTALVATAFPVWWLVPSFPALLKEVGISRPPRRGVPRLLPPRLVRMLRRRVGRRSSGRRPALDGLAFGEIGWSGRAWARGLAPAGQVAVRLLVSVHGAREPLSISEHLLERALGVGGHQIGVPMTAYVVQDRGGALGNDARRRGGERGGCEHQTLE